MMRYLVLAVMATITFSLAGMGYFCLTSPGLVENEVVFEVSPGEPFILVAKRLKNEGLISDAMLFRVLGQFSAKSKSVRTGEYLLNKGMLPMQVLEVITGGKSIAYTVTFPEGHNMYELAEMAENKGFGTKEEFLKLATDKAFIKQLLGEEVHSLEGYLFPETYTYTKYETNKDLLRMMVKRFLNVYESLSNINDGTLTRHQWVILSSIIEKETGFKKERKIISSVFHNRLKKRMRLQTDPTVLYGMLDETKVMKNNIRKKDLRKKNKYNTYTFRGLPFGPISNPGRDALEAAMRPAKTDYLYFVSRNDGTSYFSSTLREHNNAVRKYQINRSARKGKSWRDIHKKNN